MVIVGGLALVVCGPFVRVPTGGALVGAAELPAFDVALVGAVVGVAPADAVVVQPPSVPDPSTGASVWAVVAGVGAVETLAGVLARSQPRRCRQREGRPFQQLSYLLPTSTAAALSLCCGTGAALLADDPLDSSMRGPSRPQTSHGRSSSAAGWPDQQVPRATRSGEAYRRHRRVLG